MISNSWIEQRLPNWNNLENLLYRAEQHGLKSLDAAELESFGLLYRQAATDLAAVRGERAARVVEQYLNRLVSRAHHYVYAGGKITLRTLLTFFLKEYPLIFRRLFPFTLAALLIFVAGGVLGTMLTLVRPDFMRAYLGPEMVETIEHHQMWTESLVSVSPQASAAIATNNISVCFVTFAGGVLGSLGSLFLLFQNGMLMGVVATACAQQGMSMNLWSFVVAHGSLELPCIFIAGGAGLRLGWGVLFPGILRWKGSVALAGAESLRLVSAIIPLLLVAGFLEAFLSPAHVPLPIKFGVGIFLFSLLCFWLTSSRAQNQQPLEEQARAVRAFRAL
jgi:uncharacterized membrane protein SpoIIM required for sporulation